MIRIKCPKCANALGVPESAAGSAAVCPQCGQKFRVPAIAAKASGPSRPEAARQQKDSGPDDEHVAAGRRRPVVDKPARTSPARRRSEADDREDEDFEVVPDPARSEPSRSLGKRRVVDDVDESDEEKPNRRDEAPRPPTRKKKKKKKEAGGLSGVHIAFIAVGLLVVGGLTLLFFLMQHGLKPKAPPDPAPVLAELQQIHAMIERDEKSPDKPVIGVTLSGLEFRPSLLGRLVAFPKLRKLNLSGTKTSDIALEHLEDVTSLQILNLSHTNVTGGGMQFLKKLVNLEELNLNQTLVHDPGLHELTGLKKLKKIYLDGTLASGMELQAAIPGLEVIK
jgi:hypothetical protein